MSLPKIAVFISGRGTDLQSIIDAVARQELHAEIALVVSDKADAYGLERARKNNIPIAVVIKKNYDSVEGFEQAILDELAKYDVQHVVLAGFMKILSPYFITHFKEKILNIHPSLLPAFPGAHAHRDALAYGVKVSGCTVHFVDEGMDSGPIIAQVTVPIEDDDTEETLAAKVLAQEHILYPKVIENYLQNKYKIEGRVVKTLS